uniref:Putative secreted peptide n=1 Tax=Anopheles braziliensis TaxID=58242 RepID=A0A2M3ZXG2_9DIPT
MCRVEGTFLTSLSALAVNSKLAICVPLRRVMNVGPSFIYVIMRTSEIKHTFEQSLTTDSGQFFFYVDVMPRSVDSKMTSAA